MNVEQTDVDVSEVLANNATSEAEGKLMADPEIVKATTSMAEVEIDNLEHMTGIIESIIVKDEPVKRSVFEVYLLPYILGIYEHNETNTNTYVKNFIGLSKKPTIGLRVVDDIDEEKVLYKLPPLIMNPAIDNLKDMPFGRLVSHYNKLTDTNPARAEAMLFDMVKDIASGIDVDEDEWNEYTKSFLDIRRDYEEFRKQKMEEIEKAKNKENGDDVTEEKEIEVKPTKKKAFVNNNEDDIFDYD